LRIEANLKNNTKKKKQDLPFLLDSKFEKSEFYFELLASNSKVIFVFFFEIKV
jgi:hypothetical protein